MDTDSRLTTSTTRRTIVATGAKLAYAAPLVATSVALSAANAAARISPPPTNVCIPYEAFKFPPCETDAHCASRASCHGYCCITCVTGLPGDGVCICRMKVTYGPCTRDEECCTGTCERSRGALTGTCACSPKGGPCLDSGDCCSGRCAPDPASGAGICV